MIYINFLEKVDIKYKEWHNAKNYTEELRISASKLNSCTTYFSHRTASELINERIILEAKRLLYELCRTSIKEIAYELGFEDNSNFVKHFKRHTGMTPTEYRASVWR